MKVGSICSGIEAASVAWSELNSKFLWFSEIAPFPSRFLAGKYPDVPNLGDLNNIPKLISEHKVPCPDIICGGTPCQAFSVTGHQKGLEDSRGQLTLKFIEVIEANDAVKKGKGTIVFWENVEGVLKDKTNAFGCFISSLAGCEDVLPVTKWTNAGFVRGPVRNVAWRILDAKYFGVPQQRRRLYVLAGGKDFHPERILFEHHNNAPLGTFNKVNLTFNKGGKHFQVFREYTDCLYSAYGTKWNGNAAAYNGSLYVCENNRLRRLTPLETERLMGFPDNYTDVPFARRTNRFQGVGNSWAVPVVRWIGNRLFNKDLQETFSIQKDSFTALQFVSIVNSCEVYLFNDPLVQVDTTTSINVSATPENIVQSNIADVIDTNADEALFISPVGCKGILRRAIERGMNLNPQLKIVLENITTQMPDDEIEKRSRIQPRGKYTIAIETGAKPLPQKKKREKRSTQTVEQPTFEF